MQQAQVLSKHATISLLEACDRAERLTAPPSPPRPRPSAALASTASAPANTGGKKGQPGKSGSSSGRGKGSNNGTGSGVGSGGMAGKAGGTGVVSSQLVGVLFQTVDGLVKARELSHSELVKVVELGAGLEVVSAGAGEQRCVMSVQLLQQYEGVQPMAVGDSLVGKSSSSSGVGGGGGGGGSKRSGRQQQQNQAGSGGNLGGCLQVCACS